MKIGLLGGGQLALMMTEAAYKLNIDVVILEKNKFCPAASLCKEIIFSDFNDTDALSYLGKTCEVFTVESENIPIKSLKFLSKFGEVKPGTNCIEICQDRIKEKSFLEEISLPIVPFSLIDSTEVISVVSENLFPGILKTSRFGYDGKGQVHVYNKNELLTAYEKLGKVDCILEKKINLDKEISIILVRNSNGKIASYPPAENIHENGILKTSFMPCKLKKNFLLEAFEYASRIADKLNYCGVMCVEFFFSDEKLFVNEIAPRPHNSGHQTIEACDCSQFEQQVRVCANLPIGSTKINGNAKLTNLLGDLWFSNPNKVASNPDWNKYKRKGTTIHLYGKKEAKIGRKMGHLVEFSRYDD